MNEREMLDRFLRTDPRDVGCGEAIAVLHVYVDLVASGQDAAARYPGVATHLAACGPCGDDFAGLLAAVTSEQPET
jgi:hypothetical protein